LVHLNNGKAHAPIKKVRIYEEGSKFSVGTEGTKKDKYVEAAKGTNLFFAIYWDEEKKKRTYETIPLNEVIAHQKWRATLPKAEQIRIPMIPIKIEMGMFLFSLSPNDLVYLTEQDEYADVEVLNPSGINKTVSFSGNQCFFVRHDVATGIVNKVEFSALNKMEKSIGGVMIKDKCIKLKVDRIGNVKKAI
jgi:CRISPR-associated endonuclease Csn1